ncbi:MAG: phosphoribosyl-ATP diphosphatase [Hyphomicrobiaceae bacterium]
MDVTVIDRLAALIAARRAAKADASYTRQLLDAGTAKCAKKLGEEATETIIAALSENDEALANEAADLLYHLMVLLESRRVGLDRVLAKLEGRMGTSGIAEKSARSSPG